MEVLGGPSGSSGQVSLVLHKEGRRKVPALALFWGGLEVESRRDPGGDLGPTIAMGRP